jgi:hypothetical protein
LLVYKGVKDPGQEIPVNTVLADFYLPYICASNCTPVDVTIQATPPAENKSPKAVAETSKANITLPGENKVILTGQNSSDPDAGAILTYSWSLEAGSSGAVIDTPAAVTSQVNFSKTGLYVFKLTVTDNKLATATDKVFVLVNESPNQIPVARAFSDKGNLEFVKGKEVVATLHGENSEDPEGKPLEYKWSLQGNTGTVSIAKEKAPITAVKFTEPGSYLFTLTVTDNKHASANDYVLVTVREKSKEVKCAPLSEIVQQFYNLGDVDGEGVLSTFKEKYKDYFRVKEFYDSLQKQKIPTVPIPEQVAFFTGSSVADFVESWISDLTKIITENKELRLLALSMLNIHAQLAYYIACIQDKDINQAEAPMETALSVLSRVLYSIADVASDFSQPQKNALIELLTLTRNEKERVVQKLEDKQKPVFMLLLTRIFDELDSWNL